MARIPPPADPLGVLSCLCCLGTHVVAGLASLVVLIPGSPMVADPMKRAAYLASHQGMWAVMWATWAMAAVSLFGFYWALGSRLENRPPRLMRQMSWIMLIALGVDISSQVLYATMTPGIAQALLVAPAEWREVALARLVWSERIPALLSGGVANCLYSLAGVLVCLAAARDPRFPRGLRLAALPGWIGGLALGVASILHDPTWIALTTAFAIGPFMLWCAAVAVFFFWRVPPAFRAAGEVA